jgi:uncharacterized protein YxjI
MPVRNPLPMLVIIHEQRPRFADTLAREGIRGKHRYRVPNPNKEVWMGLRDRHDGGSTLTFQMREKMFAIGDDYWIEDDQGKKAYKVNGKALHLRQTFVLEDASGKELATIREKKLAVRDTMKIERGDREAKVHKRMVGIRDRYVVDMDEGEGYTAKGNFVDHEYEVERDGTKVAEVSKKWFRVRDTYGVQIFGEQDVALILAITVCIDSLSHDRG